MASPSLVEAAGVEPFDLDAPAEGVLNCFGTAAGLALLTAGDEVDGPIPLELTGFFLRVLEGVPLDELEGRDC